MPTRRKPNEWSENTIVNVFSSTKNVTALAALMLIDRGLLDPFAPVAKYWPEFAANGKHDVEVRHILSHTSGVSGWDMPFRPGGHLRLGEIDIPTRRSGTVVVTGYRVRLSRPNHGHLVGEVVRRITGKG